MAALGEPTTRLPVTSTLRPEPQPDCDGELPRAVECGAELPRAVASAHRGEPKGVRDDEDAGPPDLDDRAPLAFDGDDRAVLPRHIRGRRLRGLLDAAEATALVERAAGSAFATGRDSVDDLPAYERVVYDRGRVLDPELWGLAEAAIARATPALRAEFGCSTLEASQCLLRRYRPGERREHPAHFDAHARATLVVALSEASDYDGGYYALPDHGAPRRFVDLDRGSGFAHGWDLRHGVSVTRGSRVSLVCWFLPAENLRDGDGPSPWHAAAAAQGHPDALFALATVARRAAEEADGGADADRAAARALAAAADAGSPEAAELHGAALVADGDADAGLARLAEAAAAGHARAMRRLAMALSFRGDDGRRAAMGWLRRAARGHDAEAMYDLWNADPGAASAAAWLDRAALLGQPNAVDAARAAFVAQDLGAVLTIDTAAGPRRADGEPDSPDSRE